MRPASPNSDGPETVGPGERPFVISVPEDEVGQHGGGNAASIRTGNRERAPDGEPDDGVGLELGGQHQLKHFQSEAVCHDAASCVIQRKQWFGS